MLLASGLAAAVLVVATVFVARAALRADGAQRELESTIVRTSAARRERARFATTREAIAGTAESAAEAVQFSAATVQVGHEVIASIPFGVLEAIPATRAGTKRVRSVHDETAGGVYRAINVISGAVGNVVSRKMKGTEPPPGE